MKLTDAYAGIAGIVALIFTWWTQTLYQVYLWAVGGALEATLFLGSLIGIAVLAVYNQVTYGKVVA